ncbi:ABC transporter permease subunit, partial [Aliarcobacter butzleri]
LFSKTIGIPSNKILRKHLLPSISSDIVVLATIDTGWVILSISALSFLGLGIQAPTPEWGMMLNEAKNMLSMEPSLMFPA